MEKGILYSRGKALTMRCISFMVVGAFCAVECEVVRRVQMIEIVCGIYKCLVTYHFTVIVDENITHDGIYPSFKVGIRCVLSSLSRAFRDVS